MNCDQVFDVLTRGPFPTGHLSDRAVEDHLAHCSECHRLASALQPALELFQEAITGEEAQELPGYWGELVEQPVSYAGHGPLAQVARKLPVALHRRLDRGRRWISRQSGGSAARFAAAVLIGAMLAIVVWTAGVPLHQNDGDDRRLADATPREDFAGGEISMSSVPSPHVADSSGIKLNLVAACLTDIRPTSVWEPTIADSLPISVSLADLARLDCCTNCHHAQSARPIPRATATVSHSCEHCHRR